MKKIALRVHTNKIKQWKLERSLTKMLKQWTLFLSGPSKVLQKSRPEFVKFSSKQAKRATFQVRASS